MRKGILLFLLLLGASCQTEEPPISEKKLAAILQEMHIAETFAQINAIDVDGYLKKNYDTLFVHYSHIYKKYDIDTASFHKAIEWYKKNPTNFDKVYEQVLSEMSMLKERFKDTISEGSDSLSIHTDTARKKIPRTNQYIKNSLKE